MKKLRRKRHLLDEADEQGYLTLDDVLEAFPHAEENVERLDETWTALLDRGIAVYDDELQVEGLAEDVGPPVERDAGVLEGIGAGDSVSLYMAEMGRVPLLTADEEVELAKRVERGRQAQQELSHNGHGSEERERLQDLIRDGDEARDHMIAANTRLVVSIAKNYRGLGLSFLDLVQAGNLGLIKAVDRFDYRRGHKLGTYATWWIRQAVTRAISKTGRTIRLPVYVGERVRKLYRVAQRIEQELGRRPTPAEIAEEMAGVDTKEARWLLRVSRLPLSLHLPMNAEEEAEEFGDFIEDQDTPPPDERVELDLLREQLEDLLGTLRQREARVLRMRFGLENERPHTLKEVGEKLGVSRERARQIQAQAISKLRHPHRRRELVGYLR